MCAAGRSSWGFDGRRRPVGKTGFVLDKWRGKAPLRLLLLFRSGGNRGNGEEETVFREAESRRFARTLYVSGRQMVGSGAEDGMKWKRKTDVFCSEKHCFRLAEALFCFR